MLSSQVDYLLCESLLYRKFLVILDYLYFFLIFRGFN